MKRSELKPGKPLERRAPLKRSAGPRVSSSKSSTGGKGKGRKPKGDGAMRWYVAVVNGPCVMCSGTLITWSHVQWAAYGWMVLRLDAHHLIPKGTLIREGHAAHVNDPRNGISACRFHHSRHHAYVERIPRSLLPVAVFEFAAELGLEAILDREYPVVEQHPLNNAIEGQAA